MLIVAKCGKLAFFRVHAEIVSAQKHKQPRQNGEVVGGIKRTGVKSERAQPIIRIQEIGQCYFIPEKVEKAAPVDADSIGYEKHCGVHRDSEQGNYFFERLFEQGRKQYAKSEQMQYAEPYNDTVQSDKAASPCYQSKRYAYRGEYQPSFKIGMGQVAGYARYDDKQRGKIRLGRREKVEQPACKAPAEDAVTGVKGVKENHAYYSKSAQLVEQMNTPVFTLCHIKSRSFIFI